LKKEKDVDKLVIISQVENERKEDDIDDDVHLNVLPFQ